MHIASYKKNKNSPIRYAQQKWDPTEKVPLNAIENNGTIQKWHMTNTPLKIDKYDNHKKWSLIKMAHLAKKCSKVTCQGLN